MPPRPCAARLVPGAPAAIRRRSAHASAPRADNARPPNISPAVFSLERRCCSLSYPPGAGCPASRVGNLQKDCPKTDMRVSRDDNNHPSCAHPSSADVFKADKICWTPHKITVWQPCVLPIPAYGTKNPSSNQKADTLQPFFQFGKGAEVFGEKRSKGSTRRMI